MTLLEAFDLLRCLDVEERPRAGIHFFISFNKSTGVWLITVDCGFDYVIWLSVACRLVAAELSWMLTV